MSEVKALTVAPSTRKRSSAKRRVLRGAAVGLWFLMAAEIGFSVIADGHPNPEVRLYALAISSAAAMLAGALRNPSMLVALLALGVGTTADAADRARQYNVTLASSACPTGNPGKLYDLKVPGIALSGLRAYNLTVCPTSGQTFTGTGGWRACVYRESPGPMQWVLAPLFYIDMTDDGYGNPITSTTDNPCLTFWDIQIGVNDGDLVYIYPTTTLGVSGGVAISVYLEGVL